MQLNDYNKLCIDMKTVVGALCTITTEKNVPEKNLESIINLKLDSTLVSERGCRKDKKKCVFVHFQDNEKVFK